VTSRRLAGSIGYLTGTRLAVNTAWRFVYPFLPAISRGLGISLERAGLLVSARSIAGMATPAVVATVGRGERRRRLVAVTLVLFVIGVSLTAATGAFTGALVGFVLIGLAKPSFDVAAHAYIADRVPYRRRARALAIFELTWAGSLLVGAPLTGWMIDRIGWRAPFWAFAVLGVVALLVLRPAIDEDAFGAGAAVERFRPTGTAVALLASAFFFNLGAETTIVVFGAWLEDGFGISVVALGSLTIVLALAELAGEGTTFAFTDRVGKRRMVAIGLVVSATSFASLGFLADSIPGGMGALGVAYFAYEVTIVSAIPLTTELMPGARARLLALFQLAGQGARALGAAIAPVVFARGGIGANGALSAAFHVISLAILLRWVHER
jgi:predicted MFS family arabinose efflux permease